MTTDTLTIDGLDIFYRCSGNSLSSRAFSKQLDSALAEDYRLYAFDLPGHGESADASDPSHSYTLHNYARICTEFASCHEIENGVFVGWSLGGHILLEAADQLTSARGLLIFGTPPTCPFSGCTRTIRQSG